MKKTVVLVAMMAAAAPAFAEDELERRAAAEKLGRDIDEALKQDPETKAWVVKGSALDDDDKAVCTKTIEKITALGIPGTTKVKIQNDTAELPRGEHTIDDLVPICARVAEAAKTKKFEKWAYEALRENPRVTAKTPFEIKYFKNCITMYEAMLKTGVSPRTKIPEHMVADNDGKMVKFGGTVEEVRKQWCDVGLAKAKAEIARRDAPYVKALKGDKLATALEWRSVILPGGSPTSDPAAMAKVNVWFTDAFPGLVCLKKGVPEVHEVTRLEFDKASKLVKTSSTKYCGEPPASAYK